MKNINRNSLSSPAMQEAMSCYASGQISAAEEMYRKILLDNPKDAYPMLMLGIIADEAGRHDEAVAMLNRAIKTKKDDPLLFFTLGFALQRGGKLDEALLKYRKAISLKQDYREAYNHMGDILKDLGRFDEAELRYKRSIALKPDDAVVHYCLGQVLNEQDKFDEAALAYRKAIALKPDYAEACSNLGIIINAQKKTDEAIGLYRRAISLKPDYTAAHYNLGLSLLTSGMYQEGWQKYEYRWDVDTNNANGKRLFTSLPQWVGQNPQPDDRLLIYAEQGLGDKLQFSRYIPLAAERFPGRVSAIVDHSLQSLLHRSFPDIDIISTIPADERVWQWQCPLLSLPLAFGTTLQNIPGQAPYLVPDPVRRAYWKSKIAALDLPAGTRKIGVVWKPGKFMKIAQFKALAFQQLVPLLEQSGTAWFSLQKEPDPDSASWISSGRLVDWSGEFKDFDDTAALAVNLDLVISVDTSVVHLAGGLGLPTWLFNRHASDWRWMYDREDSPWYPSMRIFTQEAEGDWNSVVKRMITALG